jgi:hypothetical protein
MPSQPRRTTYPTPAAEREAAERSLAMGRSARAVQLLSHRPARDVRNGPVGTFAGTIGPDASVGTFGGVIRLRRQAAGGWAGNPDSQRQGSFGDVEHAESAEAVRIDTPLEDLPRAA